MRNLQHFLGFVNLYSHVIKDVCECTASSVQNKSSSLLFMGPLRPLSVPGWPCSHISLNLISVNNWPVFQRCSLCGSAKTAHNYRKCSASNSSCIFASSYRKPFGIKGLRVRGIPGTTATSIPIQEGLFCSSFWAASPLPLLSAFDGGPCSSIDDTRTKQAPGLPTAWHPSTLQVWLSSKNVQLWNVFQKLF